MALLTVTDTCFWPPWWECNGLERRSSHGRAHHAWWPQRRWCSTHFLDWLCTKSEWNKWLDYLLFKTLLWEDCGNVGCTCISLAVDVLGASGLVSEMVYIISLVWFPASSFFHGWYTTSEKHNKAREWRQRRLRPLPHRGQRLTNLKFVFVRWSHSWIVTVWIGCHTACPHWTWRLHWCAAFHSDLHGRPLHLRERERERVSIFTSMFHSVVTLCNLIAILHLHRAFQTSH